MTFCTFITVHLPSGHFYIGKGKTASVLAGKYRGSGIKLKNYFKKYPKEEWQCGVLWQFEDEDKAYSDEGGIITQDMLDDPLCLNLDFGGRSIRYADIGRRQSETKQAMFADPIAGLAARANYRAGRIKLLTDPIARKALIGAAQTPEAKAKRVASLIVANTQEVCAQRSAAQRIAMNRPENAAARHERALEVNNRPEVREAKSRTAKLTLSLVPKEEKTRRARQAIKTLGQDGLLAKAAKVAATLGAEGCRQRALSIWESRRENGTDKQTPEQRAANGQRKAKPCTVDGITIYQSAKALAQVLGTGKAGIRSPNFRYVENV